MLGSEMNMRRTLAVSCLLVAVLAPVAVAQEVGNDVRKAGISLFGENVGTITLRHVSATLASLCPDATFYTATMVVPLDELEKLPTANPPRLFAIRANGQSFSLVTAKEICAFLGDAAKSVEDELSAYRRALAFAELIGGSVRTRVPEKASIIAKYKTQKPEDWPVVIAGTESGWSVSFTLMTDAGIEYCVRYTLRIDKDGKTVALMNERTVYTYTLYE